MLDSNLKDLMKLTVLRNLIVCCWVAWYMLCSEFLLTTLIFQSVPGVSVGWTLESFKEDSTLSQGYEGIQVNLPTKGSASHRSICWWLSQRCNRSIDDKWLSSTSVREHCYLDKWEVEHRRIIKYRACCEIVWLINTLTNLKIEVSWPIPVLHHHWIGS